MPQWIPGVDADFVWVVPGLAVGGQPSRQQMGRLHSHGIDAMLSVRAEDDPEDDPDCAHRHGLRYQRVVVADGVAISQEALNEITCIVHKWRSAGLGVLIHCQAGRRRGPIAVAAVLVDEGWSVHNALKRVVAVRKQTAPTPEQLSSLKRFALRHLHHRVINAVHELRHTNVTMVHHRSLPSSHPHLHT
ncbi:MAG: dual specificity protein phosphatase family protein [Chloroflexi bacterium]|nr:dual specificity protein phosphatase family protein [Chloroflexota bacterium]